MRTGIVESGEGSRNVPDQLLGTRFSAVVVAIAVGSEDDVVSVGEEGHGGD
jgi:hypothetical protein